ncbi:TIGR02466 family protein [Tabrizicola sp.]|uniref:TIGR02466 family protein n=1 Tax=Tabrizicola sp. TaxID=2005166 RepID=UPI003D291638
MSNTTNLFVTPLYRARLNDLAKKKVDYEELKSTCLAIAEDDEAGQEWCEKEGYPGYTSYASLDDLPWRAPIFADLEKALDKHVAAFCDALGFDLQGKKLKCNAFWINILPEGGTHSSHIHPHSVISGTTYVAMPEGTSALKLEDPRLAMMMLSPLRRKDAPQELQPFVYVKPEVGELLLWESWLRHEVPMNMSEEERISVSFNYNWA